MYLQVMSGDSEVTQWIDANASYLGVGNPGASSDGDAGVTSATNHSGNGYDFLRTITFGTVTRTGTVYVRVGWDSGGGTSATSNNTRKFKYIYKTQHKKWH